MNCRILEDKRTCKILPIALPYLSTSSTNLLPKFILSVASAEALQHRQLQEAETRAEGPVLSSQLRTHEVDRSPGCLDKTYRPVLPISYDCNDLIRFQLKVWKNINKCWIRLTKPFRNFQKPQVRNDFKYRTVRVPHQVISEDLSALEPPSSATIDTPPPSSRGFSSTVTPNLKLHSHCTRMHSRHRGFVDQNSSELIRTSHKSIQVLMYQYLSLAA